LAEQIADAVADACTTHDANPANLIQILRAVQDQLGYIPEEAQRLTAVQLGIPSARVYGVVTFYHLFSTQPRGRHILRLCQGTACHVAGSGAILEAIGRRFDVRPGETTADRLFTLETVACLGACALAPVMVLDGVYHGHLSEATAVRILEELTDGAEGVPT